MDECTPHPLYTGATEATESIVVDDDAEGAVKTPLRFHLKKPDDGAGNERDQTHDAADHMRYAASLGLPELTMRPTPRLGRAVIIGGAPSVKDQLEEIKRLAADPQNRIFTLNWMHTWLIQNGVIPHGSVFFEIDAEPDSVLKAAHPDVTYFICSHCHPKTFDDLKNNKRVLWHSMPNSPPEKEVKSEFFKDSAMCGGGVSTFTRAMTIALHLGFRHLDLFGCDSSFPEEGTTHVNGYETIMDNKTDGFNVWAKATKTGEVRRFRTVGYLAMQAEEFKIYCRTNHSYFSLCVHGDSLLRFVHEQEWPEQYL